jgi:predicted acylesterase/phospholipase RssA
MSKHYTHLVLSGGGMSGLVYLGALRYLQQEGYDKHILHIAGASIGALFATAFALDMSMGDLEQKYKEFLSNEEKCLLPTFTMDTIIESYDNLGVDDGKRLTEPIEEIVGNLTFLELSKKTGKNLIISATHIETMLPTYFSVDNTPNVLVLDAVKASMAIPLFVRPIEIGDDYYMDGGVTDGIPVNAFTNVSPESILVLHLARNSVKVKCLQEKPSFIKLMTSMLQTFLRNYLGIRLLENTYPNYCQFTMCPVSFIPLKWEDEKLKISISNEKIDESVIVGYTKLQQFLQIKALKHNQ